MGALFVTIPIVVLLGIVGVTIALSRMSDRKAREQREAAQQVRSQRVRTAAHRESPQPMPAVKRSRMATPVGARR